MTRKSGSAPAGQVRRSRPVRRLACGLPQGSGRRDRGRSREDPAQAAARKVACSVNDAGPRRLHRENWPRIPFTPSGSVQLEAIRVHHLVPRRDEVLHELLTSVVLTIDLRDRPKL